MFWHTQDNIEFMDEHAYYRFTDDDEVDSEKTTWTNYRGSSK